MFVRLTGPLEERWPWLEDVWPQLPSAFAAIAFAYVGVSLSLSLEEEDPWWFVTSTPGVVFFIGTALALIGAFVNARRNRALRPLRKRVEKLEGILEQVPGHYYDLCSYALADILRGTLRLDDTERISVYRHRGKGAFQIIGRYSENPKFAQLGRRVYPDNEGVIGHAWEHETATADNLPDPEEEPEHYYQILESEWNIRRETAENFTMKSRNLVACALYEPKGVERVAIVVVESTRVGILDVGKVTQAVKGEEGKRIYLFLEKMQALEPDIEYPMEEGF